MPDMNGLEALQELRARGISKPIILLTGFADEAYEDAALAAGAVDFIDKSRRWQILVRRIELIAEAARGNAKPQATPGALAADDAPTAPMMTRCKSRKLTRGNARSTDQRDILRQGCVDLPQRLLHRRDPLMPNNEEVKAT
jgi:DNA-binding response OmpR family regulator